MKTLTGLLALATLATAPLGAQLINVYAQGTPNTLLGQIQAYDFTGVSSSYFTDLYGLGSGSSYNPPGASGLPAAESTYITSFFARNTNGVLGFFTVYGPDTVDPHVIEATVTVGNGATDIAQAVADDAASNWDDYYFTYGGVDTFVADNQWYGANTDGFVLKGIDTTNPDWFLTEMFSAPNKASNQPNADIFPTGIDGWKIYSADGSYISMADIEATALFAPAPEPASVALLGLLGMGGIVLLRRRKARTAA